MFKDEIDANAEDKERSCGNDINEEVLQSLENDEAMFGCARIENSKNDRKQLKDKLLVMCEKYAEVESENNKMQI